MQENNNTNRGKYIWWIFLPTIIYMAIQNVVQFMVMEVIMVYNFATLNTGGFDDLMSNILSQSLSLEANTVTYIVSAILAMVIFILLYKKSYHKPGKSYIKGIADNNLQFIIGLVIFVVGMQYLSNYLINGLSIIFPSWLETYNRLLESAGLDENMTVGMSIYTLLLGPIVEEIAYRGLAFKSACKVMDYKWAIFVQAFLFGFMHMNWLQGCYAFLFGLALGYIMYRYDNLLVTILIHIAYNILGTVGAQYLPVGGDTLISFFLWFLGSMIVTYAGLLLLNRAAPGQLIETADAEI